MLIVQISEHIKLLQNPIRDFHSVKKISQLEAERSYIVLIVSKRVVLKSFSVPKV